MNALKTFLPYLFGNKKGRSIESSLPDPIPWDSLKFEEQLMFHTLAGRLDSFVQKLHLVDLNDIQKHFHLFNFLDFLTSVNKKKIVSHFPTEYQFYQMAIGAKALVAKDLQSLLDFKTNRPTLYAILKKDRSTPGRLLLKDKNNHFLKGHNGDIWSIPILGLSGRGLSFHHSNGQTPMGVYTIDGVMPEANNKTEFGEFRRLIVNFIKSSPEEAEITQLLPKIHHKLDWWKQSVLARMLGRSLLRIHGTGKCNRNPFSSHYPMYPTSGCLATNESVNLWGRKVADQRLLLDQLMQAQGLEVLFENESKIHGLLYVVEFDDSLSALCFK